MPGRLPVLSVASPVNPAAGIPAGAVTVTGTKVVRVTGGEPLLRRNLSRLVSELSEVEGLEEITLTTNGSRLMEEAHALRAAGLRRLTVSLDSLDDAVFRAMNDADFPVHRVLRGIDAALTAGFSPIKINMVVKRGVNDDGVSAMARHFRGSQFILRFIEYMDVGNTNGWRLEEVVSSEEILNRVRSESALEALPAQYPGEVARRYRHLDGGGEIGVISSVSAPFCRGCTRARLSADGSLYLCLFATEGRNLRQPMRDGATDEELRRIIASAWGARADRYSEIRSSQTARAPKAEMSLLGG